MGHSGAEGLRIVLVSREVWPFVRGGGIGRYVAESAALLAERGADVTILTSAGFAAEHAELASAGDPRLGPRAVRWAWAEEPEGDLSPFWSAQHAWSVSCFHALRELCAADPPDLIEFEDYGGAAKATLDAARTADPAFARTRIVVRAHTTWEMTQVLDDQPLDALDARTVIALERDALRFADRLLVPGEDALAAYRRQYGEDGLAPVVDAPMAMRLEPVAAGAREAAGGPLRLLFIGRMERRKGVEELVRAVRELEGDATLTLVGGDTSTGPDGSSMRAHLESIADGDGRISFRDPLERDALGGVIREHDVVVVPSGFESFGYVPREALAENRPVVAAAGSGLEPIVEPGRSGWLVDGPSVEGLGAVLAGLAAEPERARALIEAGAPRELLESRNRPDRHVAAYREAAAAPTRRAAPAGRDDAAPLVTVVVTAIRGDGPFGRTLDSLRAQSWPRLELVLAVEDGFGVPARLLPHLHGVVPLEPGRSVAEARRAGVARRAGRGPLLLLRSGETVAPGFVERGVAALLADPELAFVTAHAAGRAEGCAPLGNHASRFVPEQPAATVVLLRADEAVYDDGELMTALAGAGRYGAVIPEPLVGHWHPPPQLRPPRPRDRRSPAAPA